MLICNTNNNLYRLFIVLPMSLVVCLSLFVVMSGFGSLYVRALHGQRFALIATNT